MNKLKELIYKIIPYKRCIGKYLTRNFSHSPVFLVGCGRSGTTALANALNEHPNLNFSGNEAPIGKHVGLLAYEFSEGKVFPWYKESIMLSDCQVKTALIDLFFDSVWGEYYGLRQNLGIFKGSLQNLRSVTMWGTKTFPNEFEASGLSWVFPKAKFIYIIRNGIDVVTSMSKFAGFSQKTFDERCLFWATTINRYDYLRNHPRSITIKFENFLNQPEETIRLILNHIDLPFSQKVLDFATGIIVHPLDKPTIKGSPKETINARGHAYDDWSKKERIMFKELCGESMKHVNYDIPF